MSFISNAAYFKAEWDNLKPLWSTLSDKNFIKFTTMFDTNYQQAKALSDRTRIEAIQRRSQEALVPITPIHPSPLAPRTVALSPLPPVQAQAPQTKKTALVGYIPSSRAVVNAHLPSVPRNRPLGLACSRLPQSELDLAPISGTGIPPMILDGTPSSPSSKKSAQVGLGILSSPFVSQSLTPQQFFESTQKEREEKGRAHQKGDEREEALSVQHPGNPQARALDPFRLPQSESAVSGLAPLPLSRTPNVGAAGHLQLCTMDGKPLSQLQPKAVSRYDFARATDELGSALAQPSRRGLTAAEQEEADIAVAIAASMATAPSATLPPVGQRTLDGVLPAGFEMQPDVFASFPEVRKAEESAPPPGPRPATLYVSEDVFNELPGDVMPGDEELLPLPLPVGLGGTDNGIFMGESLANTLSRVPDLADARAVDDGEDVGDFDPDELAKALEMSKQSS